MQYKILLIDDDELYSKSLAVGLDGFEVVRAKNIEEAKVHLNESIDIILLDLILDSSKPEELLGLEILEYGNKYYPDTPIVVMTNYGTINRAVNVMKKGAFDFVQKKDFVITKWKKRLSTYCRKNELERELEGFKERYIQHEIIGKSDRILKVREKLRALGGIGNVSLLITGETGVGKDLAARYFHIHSARSRGPFIPISISSLSESVIESEMFGHVKGAFTGADSGKEGFFKAADGGILFLDEIGEVAIETQVKLLRFLEDKVIYIVGSTEPCQLDVQLVTATNRNLEEAVGDGNLRNDLYYRLKQYELVIPPLRDRIEDIPLLLEHFNNIMKIQGRPFVDNFSNEVIDVFVNYIWPGNVRELMNTLETGCINAKIERSNILQLDHLPHRFSRGSDTTQSKLHKQELEYDRNRTIMMADLVAINQALGETGGRKSEAAKVLGWNSDQIRYRVLKAKKKNFDLSKFDNIQKYYP